MIWILFSLLGVLLNTACSFIDKFLLSTPQKVQPTKLSLLAISGVIGLIVPLFILIINPSIIFFDIYSLIGILSGFIFMIAIWFYFVALEESETTLVMSLLQLGPVFSYVFGILFLGEFLNSAKLISGIIIVIAAIGLSLDFTDNSRKINSHALVYVLLTTASFSLSSVVFKITGIEHEYWSTAFWNAIGYFITGLVIFLLSAHTRHNIKNYFKSKSSLIINGTNEIISFSADMSMNFAVLLAPVVMVGLVSSVQPFVVFITGALLTIFFPHIIREDLSKKSIIQKLGFMTIMSIGLVFLLI